MLAFGPTLLALLQSRREIYIKSLATAIKNSREILPVTQPDYDHDALAQIIDGYIAMITEALEDRDPPVIATVYFESIIPSLVAAGERVDTMVHVTVGMMVFIADDVGRHVDPEIRDAAMDWLSRFFATWVARIVTVKGSPASSMNPLSAR
ncbi:hypothetical protein [Polyangium sp. 15x6]|uniref:hypothetical protein n=1 Tax=Polyangium sp. 15x6 TaxID=3042687 RepID=UPI00249A1251|nr:hypothetical protein [Polyangium sp. 15x6]MDI3284909.1 hypothetical protein [Polyangium sp. 15x6]